MRGYADTPPDRTADEGTWRLVTPPKEQENRGRGTPEATSTQSRYIYWSTLSNLLTRVLSNYFHRGTSYPTAQRHHVFDRLPVHGLTLLAYFSPTTNTRATHKRHAPAQPFIADHFVAFLSFRYLKRPVTGEGTTITEKR